MSSVRKVQVLTAQEFLAAEQQADIRHELVGGQTYARVGASGLHNLLAMALAAKLHGHMRPPCHTYMSDMKVRVADDFYYPDIVVSCEPLTRHTYYLEQPVAIIEILSPSTEIRDRLEKRIAYQQLPSLQEYVLVTQEKILIEAYRRSADGWEVETYRDHDTLQLKSIDFTIPLNELYLQVARVL